MVPDGAGRLDDAESGVASPSIEPGSRSAAATAAGPPLRIVAIGGSAGALSALEAFFAAVDSTSGCAFIIVEHLSPAFECLLDELLARRTRMPVSFARSGEELRRDEIVIVPPGRAIEVRGGRVCLHAREPNDGAAVDVVDRCFQTLADDVGPRAVGVIFSGTGRDGTAGIAAIAEAGGVVFAQSPESAEFDGMPRSAIASGLVDHVLEPSRIASAMGRLDSADITDREPEDVSEQAALSEILRLVEAVEPCSVQGFDRSLLLRRLRGRVEVVDEPSLVAYAERLQRDAGERLRLRDEFFGVQPRFFEDPESWRSLQQVVIRRLVAEAAAEPIRVWVAGCGMGHDAYATAMLLDDEMRRAGREVPVRIFCTDLLDDRVHRAARATFPLADLETVPSHLLDRYFSDQGEHRTIIPGIRGNMVFARQDVRVDPAFTRLDLVVCRNVLAQFDSAGRAAALDRIHLGLRTRGALFLGGSDPLDGVTTRLRPVDSESRIFMRRARGPEQVRPARVMDLEFVSRTTNAQVRRRRGEALLSGAIESVLRVRPGRACLLLSADGRLLHAYGDMDRYVRVGSGTTPDRLPELLVAPLRAPVETLMRRLRRGGSLATMSDVPVTVDGATELVSVDLRPVQVDAAEERVLSLVLERRGATGGPSPAWFLPDPGAGAGDGEPASDGTAGLESDDAPGIVARLRAELESARANTEALMADLAGADREREAITDQLTRANEAQQRSNAELSAVNQELHTVNQEHQAKIGELVQVNSDMENLFRTGHLGTIFLDRRLRVRRWTPVAAEYLGFDPGIADQPFASVLESIADADLGRIVDDVLSSGAPREHQLMSPDGVDLLVRIHPYRRSDDRGIDGIVLTVMDVSDLKRAEHRLRAVNDELHDRNREMESFAHTVSHDLKSPLVTIGCMMGLLRECLGIREPEAIAYIEQAEKTVGDMRQTIDDLLELSRVGRTQQRLSEFPLRELVKEVELTHASILAERGITLDVPDELPILRADRRRMLQVIDNLISNAIKYGCDHEQARIRVGGRTTDSRVEWWVEDDGLGIAADFHDQVFGLFARLRSDRPGTGVGLALVKRIVESHAGHVSVESEPGQGARFVVELPTTEASLEREGRERARESGS